MLYRHMQARTESLRANDHQVACQPCESKVVNKVLRILNWSTGIFVKIEDKEEGRLLLG